MARLPKWRVHDVCEVIYGLTQNNFDFIGGAEGTTGIGKSSFWFKCAIKLRRMGMKFNPDIHIAYDREDVIRLLTNNKHTVILADEMINVTYNRDFYESDQKVLLKALNMYRDHCNVLLFCVPQFSNLDKQLQKLCKMRVSIIRRGVGIIHMPNRSLFKDDIWDTKENMKVEAKMSRKRVTPYAKISTVRGFISFSDLTDKQKEIYLRIKQEKRNRVYSEYTDETKDKKTEIVENLYNKMIKSDMSQDELNVICNVTGYTQKEIRRKLNEMCKENKKEKRVQDYIRSTITKRKEEEKKRKKKQADKRKITIKADVGDFKPTQERDNNSEKSVATLWEEL